MRRDEPSPRPAIARSDALIAAALAGDEDAFRDIVERHERLVRGFIFGLGADADLVEELVQQTFVEAYRSLGTFRGEVNFATWLCGIARNRLRQFRRSSRRRDTMLAMQRVPEVDDRDPERRLLERETVRRVAAALSEIPPDQRLAFTLKVINGHSYEEIAALTGSSVAKLKTDVHRARQFLRSVLTPSGGPDDLS